MQRQEAHRLVRRRSHNPPTALPSPSPSQPPTAAVNQSFIFDTNFQAAELTPSFGPLSSGRQPLPPLTVLWTSLHCTTHLWPHKWSTVLVVQRQIFSPLHHAPVAPQADHDPCGSVSDPPPPPPDPGNRFHIKQDLEAMDQHHASRPSLVHPGTLVDCSCSRCPNQSWAQARSHVVSSRHTQPSSHLLRSSRKLHPVRPGSPRVGTSATTYSLLHPFLLT